MHRFKTGDQVLILPKFAHLYPGTSGLVIAVMPDPFRPIFTEYTVKFRDGSTADLFEFQVLEDLPNYRLLIADVTFESPTQVILQTATIEIDLKIHRGASDSSILGQISARHPRRFISNLEVTLMKLSTPMATCTTDNDGFFKFGRVFSGKHNIHVLIPPESLRILGIVAVD
jgi:hypothetical protein